MSKKKVNTKELAELVQGPVQKKVDKPKICHKDEPSNYDSQYAVKTAQTIFRAIKSDDKGNEGFLGVETKDVKNKPNDNPGMLYEGKKENKEKK